jgi:hypothetical protein
VPIFEISVAVHKIANTRCLNGENADPAILPDTISMLSNRSQWPTDG